MGKISDEIIKMQARHEEYFDADSPKLKAHYAAINDGRSVEAIKEINAGQTPPA